MIKKNTKDETRTSQKAARSAIGSVNQHILEFLHSCTAYQMDAIRVIIDMSTLGIQSVSETEINLVHSFLNHGYYKDDGNDFNKLMQFRQQRAEVLLESVSPFLDKDKMLIATIAIMKLSTDKEAIEKRLHNLPNHPVESIEDFPKQ